MINKTKSYLAQKFSILYYFYNQLGIRLFWTLLFNCLMVLMDGFGLTLFIPLLKVANQATSSAEQPDKLTLQIKSLFEAINLPMTIPVVLSFIVLIFAFKGIFTYLTTVFQGVTMAHFSRNLRRKNIAALNDLTYKAFVQSDFGQLQNTVTAETHRVESAAYQYIDVLKNMLIVAVYLGMSMVLDYKFSLMVIIMGLLFNIVYKFFYKKTKERSAEVTRFGHDINSNVIQGLSNFKYLKATDVISQYKQRTFRIIDEIMIAQISISKINAFLQSIREPMMIAIVSVVILVQLVYFKVAIGAIIIVLLFFYRAMATLLSLQTSWNTFLSLSGSLDNMRKFEQFLGANQEPKSAGKYKEKIQTLEFTSAGLFFESFKVLKNISLSISRRETVAFVGESGSGKSTLVNMACGLFLPDEGRYKINGRDVNEIDIASFRSRIGYISQEPTVFAVSIFQNITLWASKTPENITEFWNAVRKSNLTTFIESLPNKEDSLLGNSGINLSGGQKQRISIARELYKDIDVLIMDEATSALDSETEREVQESIDKLDGELIIMIIAHRFSTIVKADRIVVMKAGNIEAVGNYGELIRDSAYFKKLASLQNI